MSTARTLPGMLVITMAVGAFAPSAYAQKSGSSPPWQTTSIHSRPIQLAELNQRKHGNELKQRNHASQHGKLRAAHITRHKKYRVHAIARKPSVDSILLRVAPYYLTMA